MSVSTPDVRPASTGRSNRRLLLILLAVVVIGLAYGVVSMITYNPNYVKRVDHGDRFVLRTDEGVVLLSVECPPVQEKQVGKPAAEFTRSLVLNRYIRIETGVEPRDLMGWIHGYVFVRNDGQELLLNEELLRRGFARLKLMFPDLKYRDRLEAAETEAKSKKLGIWSPDYKPSAN